MAELLMARPKKRPLSPGETPPVDGSRQVRVAADLAKMIGKIVAIDGGTSAQLLDPLIRPQITSRFLEVESTAAKIDKLKEEARKKKEE